jgi:hypothetical protein
MSGVEETDRRRIQLGRVKMFSPQTRHSPTKSETENGGILRVTAGEYLVAKTNDFAALRKTNVG